MAGITLAQAETNLALWLSADQALAGGAQAYTLDIGGSRRQVTKADAAEIRNNIEYWNNWCQSLDPVGRGAGLPIMGIIPK